MAKSTPEERWKKYVYERIIALKLSGKINPLRIKGLAALHRVAPFTNEEWFKSFDQRAKSPEYLKWHEECETVANEYDLAPWVVTMICLLEEYKPETDLNYMRIERDWPRIRIVTSSTNPIFLRRLSYEAGKLGVIVVHQLSGTETTLLNLENYNPMFDTTEKPDKKDMFTIDVKTPLGYPPEAASQLQKKASSLARELATRIGFKIPKRLRASSLVNMAEVLKADKGPLKTNQAYDIIDKTCPDEDLSKDQQNRKRIASQRHRVRKRLFQQG